ncbi:MAG: uroporphyrinogen-III synthase [Deltaproteobacteria bacterium]|nr:MAG: uroporphyrinogen-III synthase [Deltaproteobacteria bacterium]
MAPGALDGLRVISFEARRADELATMLARHGASVTRAPALRETGLPESPEAQELARRLAAGDVHTVILLTGVGTRALAAAMAEPWPDFPRLLERATIIARGPKPLAALRELGVGGAHPVPAPHTWREVLGVVDALGAAAGRDVAVQEYGVPNRALLDALRARGARVLAVPVYRWALPEDTGPLRAGAAALVRRETDVAVFTNGAQVEHLFRVAEDKAALRAGLGRAVVASVGPVCSEVLEAHGVHPDLEASPPKMGPLVALVAERARAVLAAKRA